MTCIIGYVHEGKVYMGADSASNGGWITQVQKFRKVFRVNDMLWGVSGMVRTHQIIRYHVSDHLTEQDGSDDEYIFKAVPDAVRACLKEHGSANMDGNSERTPDGAMLIGWKGRLFTLHADFSVAEYEQPFAATGAGWLVALGACEALWLMQDEADPVFTIRRALSISGKFCNGVCEPYYIEVLE